MTDVLVPTEAGWYPDPHGSAAKRFWDGRIWTEHTRGHAEPHPSDAPQAPHVTSRTFARPVAPVAAQPGDGLAVTSLVLGIVSLVADVLLVPTILGIVLGVRALHRGVSDHRRGTATAGIVLSAAGLLAAVVQLGIAAAIAIPLFVAAQHAAVVTRIETAIQNGASTQGVELEPVRCVVPAAFAAGETTTCVSTTAAGQPYSIVVTFTGADGSFAWRGHIG